MRFRSGAIARPRVRSGIIEGIRESAQTRARARGSMRNKTAENFSRADERVNFGGGFHIRRVTRKRLCQYRITTVFKRWL